MLAARVLDAVADAYQAISDSHVVVVNLPVPEGIKWLSDWQSWNPDYPHEGLVRWFFVAEVALPVDRSTFMMTLDIVGRQHDDGQIVSSVLIPLIPEDITDGTVPDGEVVRHLATAVSEAGINVKPSQAVRRYISGFARSCDNVRRERG